MKKNIAPGDKFGDLEIVHEIERKKYKYVQPIRTFHCACSCGNEIAVKITLLAKGKINCGCAMRGRTPKKYVKLRIKWRDLRDRHAGEWCSEWNDFYVFLKDMGSDHFGMILRRKDETQPFSKDNCYWCPIKGKMIAHQGATKNITQWAEHLGISVDRLRLRLKNKSIEEILVKALDYDRPV